MYLAGAPKPVAAPSLFGAPAAQPTLFSAAKPAAAAKADENKAPLFGGSGPPAAEPKPSLFGGAAPAAKLAESKPPAFGGFAAPAETKAPAFNLAAPKPDENKPPAFSLSLGAPAAQPDVAKAPALPLNLGPAAAKPDAAPATSAFSFAPKPPAASPFGQSAAATTSLFGSAAAAPQPPAAQQTPAKDMRRLSMFIKSETERPCTMTTCSARCVIVHVLSEKQLLRLTELACGAGYCSTGPVWNRGRARAVAIQAGRDALRQAVRYVHRALGRLQTCVAAIVPQQCTRDVHFAFAVLSIREATPICRELPAWLARTPEDSQLSFRRRVHTQRA
jgi:hypothetical protein